MDQLAALRCDDAAGDTTEETHAEEEAEEGKK
jgi:hypothetical protein